MGDTVSVPGVKGDMREGEGRGCEDTDKIEACTRHKMAHGAYKYGAVFLLKPLSM